MKWLLSLLAACGFAQSQAMADFAKRHHVTEGQVRSMRDSGFSWSDVGEALAISDKANIPNSDVVALREAGLPWDQIASRYGLRPGDMRKKADEIKAEAVKAESGQTDAGALAAAEQPASLSRVAAKYGVSEKELAYLRGQGMGWGEIGRAVAIAQRSGQPLADVVDLRKSGLDWSQIARRFGFTVTEVAAEASEVERDGRDAELGRRTGDLK
jgi:hypothetical protein